MPELAPPTDTRLSAFLDNAASALSSAFGTDFRFWALGEDQQHWTPILVEQAAARENEAPLCSLEKDMEDRLQAAMDAIEPILVQKEGGAVLLGLPLGEADGHRVAATATLQSSTAQWTLKLARLCLNDFHLQQELHRCRDDLAVCAEQIGSDFEELSFLRTLADHLDVSELTRGPWHVAEMVLPLLAEVIRAESLVLVTAKGDCPEAEKAVAERPVVWIGSRWMSDETCLQLVENYRQAAVDRVLVQNHVADSPDGSRFPGVHKLVMTTLTKRNRVLGWLVAINHSRQPHDLAGNTLWKLSEGEFGTVEAGLLGSVGSMLATHACNVELVREKEALLINVVRAMVSAIDAKDPYTCGHSERVALVSRLLARKMGISEIDCDRVYLAGLLHDLGKLGVPDAVLSKPGTLTNEEFAMIRPHPERGWAILQDLDELSYLFPGVLHHHERFDGAGYPDGLVGQRIPLVARILAVADAYDAMISDRPYRRGMPEERVEMILREGSGTQWDPEVVGTFMGSLPEIKALWADYQQPAVRQRNGGPCDVPSPSAPAAP